MAQSDKSTSPLLSSAAGFSEFLLKPARQHFIFRQVVLLKTTGLNIDYLKMMTRFFLLAIVASFGSLVFAEDTVELTDSSFDGELEEIDTALVMFYAPW